MAAGGTPNPLTLIHGEERFLVDRSIAEWRALARPPELDVEVYDAPARLDELRHSIREMPLFDPERAILVRDPAQLAGATRRGAADPPDRLASMLSERAPTTLLCLAVHVKVAAQNPVLAAVRELGGVIVFHPARKGRELRAWVEAEVAARGLRLGPGGVEHITRVAGPDLGVISSELDKLVAYAGGRPLSRADLEQAVAGDEATGLYETVNDLLGPIPARGAVTLDRLLGEGRAGQYLLAILSGQIRDLVMAQAYLHTHGSAGGMAAELRVPEWRADRLGRQARTVPPLLAAGWLRALHEVDRGVKMGEIGEAEGLRLVALRAAAQLTELSARGRR